MRFRDEIVMIAENWWPEIQEVLTTPASLPRIRYVLEAVQAKYAGAAIAHLVANAALLAVAVDSGRLRNDPRQLANAMAGVPQVSFWNSLRRCQRVQCESAIGLRALRSYIERKHPRLARRLDDCNAEDVLAVRSILNEYDLRDLRLIAFRKHPLRLQMIWQAGKPDWTKLGLTRMP